MALTPVLGALSSWSTPSSFFIPTFACLLASLREDQTRSYDNYQVVRLQIENEQQYEMVQSLYYDGEFDFWSPPSYKTHPTDIMMSPAQIEKANTLLRFLGVPFKTIIPNVQEVIDEERNFLLRQAPGMSWNSFQRLNTIYSWMDSMAQQYPALVSVMEVGKSGEGRPMKVMKISSGGDANKSAIWLDGGIHAREWISPATVTYMANELITSYTRKRQTRMVDTFDWYINPLMNPDGYDYTFTNDRMWRKTRAGPSRPIFGGLAGCCKGTDPNRNWDFNWGGKGTSDNLCSQIYRGPKPASEPEVYNIQNFIMERKDKIKLFLTFHSYSQLVLLPWSHDNIRTDDHDELTKMAEISVKALGSVYGTHYKYGPTPEILYPAAGGSHDWAKGKAGIKFAYCFELRDTGTFGFMLPPNQIEPSGKETFVAVKAMADEVSKYYNLHPTRVEGDKLFETD